MSYQTVAARRTDDTALLDDKTCPALEPGEWIRYWTRLPHGARARVDEAAREITYDPDKGTSSYAYRPVAKGRQTLIEGIVEMHLFDEKKRVVAWSEDRASELLDGIPPGALVMLGVLIGSKEPPSLSVYLTNAGEPAETDADGNPVDADGQPDADAETAGNA